VLDWGWLLEEGTFQELLQDNTLFARMYRAQSLISAGKRAAADAPSDAELIIAEGSV
jgi:hypothetical protein